MNVTLCPTAAGFGDEAIEIADDEAAVLAVKADVPELDVKFASPEYDAEIEWHRRSEGV